MHSIITLFLKNGTRVRYLIRDDPNKVKSAIQSIYGDFVNIKVEPIQRKDLYSVLANLHVLRQKGEI